MSACTNLFCKYQGKGADGSLTYKPGNGQSLETTIHHEYELEKTTSTWYSLYSDDNKVVKRDGSDLLGPLDTTISYEIKLSQSNQEATFVYQNGQWCVVFDQYNQINDEHD